MHLHSNIVMNKIVKITRLDEMRIKDILHQNIGNHSEGHLLKLINKIESAKILDILDVPKNLVTMNSRILIKDLLREEKRVIKLVYPDSAWKGKSLISILSPLGCMLLGSVVGQIIVFEDNDGLLSKIYITKILYQPEGSAHYSV